MESEAVEEVGHVVESHQLAGLEVVQLEQRRLVPYDSSTELNLHSYSTAWMSGNYGICLGKMPLCRQ